MIPQAKSLLPFALLALPALAGIDSGGGPSSGGATLNHSSIGDPSPRHHRQRTPPTLGSNIASFIEPQIQHQNTSMKTASIIGYSLILAASSNATTMSFSFMAYDQYPGHSPYYSHYAARDAGGTPVAGIDHLDRGWGFSTTGNSAYHVQSNIEGLGTSPRPLRTAGWHEYELHFNEATKVTRILMDGNLIQSRSYSPKPQDFAFGFHDYYGGVQETVIDNFRFWVNDTVVYTQDFETPTLDSSWSVDWLTSGTYFGSGDPTTPFEGIGALALGATTGGNLFASISYTPDPSLFEISPIPEPASTAGLAFVIAAGLSFRKRYGATEGKGSRPKASDLTQKG